MSTSYRSPTQPSRPATHLTHGKSAYTAEHGLRSDRDRDRACTDAAIAASADTSVRTVQTIVPGVIQTAGDEIHARDRTCGRHSSGRSQTNTSRPRLPSLHRQANMDKRLRSSLIYQVLVRSHRLRVAYGIFKCTACCATRPVCLSPTLAPTTYILVLLSSSPPNRLRRGSHPAPP